ncbi:ribonuclease R [Metallumcola ferriviriculae]|uniref:Ribonuclease R n=1 Tax=Metallumcola ferriviriculae TaxID=3039180 RepID=A0AAU0UL99_9FIRM|nr:ribonuclease R [Desulfitibacteraceae bacterium MK1]
MNKQDILEFMREKTYKPLTAEELVAVLNIHDTGEVESFLSILREMERRGEVILTRKSKYGLAEKMGLAVGRLQGHAKGFGFIITDQVGEADIFISPENMNGAMHNDRVVARRQSSGRNGKPEGEIIRILERANEKIVGTFERSKNFGFVVADDRRIRQDIYIAKGGTMDAHTKDKVVVSIIHWPQGGRNPEGRVIEVLGKEDDPGVDVVSIVRKHQLPENFPDKVTSEAARVAKISEEDYRDRKDLRQWKTVTIDGADAKDLDDAITIEKHGNNYRLGVHIADVSYYVKDGSELDKEAYSRATSVYLVDRVIPMLPPQLSNDICSLNAGVDRLAMSVIMEVTADGTVADYEITPSVINVNHRMTYAAVREILEEKDRDLVEKYQEFVPEFEMMAELCGILRKNRLKRGAIDFEFPESKVILDEQGKPQEIKKIERSVAEKLIEEFMILANETVAEHMFWAEAPFVYRVHQQPDPDDFGELNDFLHRLGYHISGKADKLEPASYQEVIAKVQGKPEERVISTVMLRSMKHARYASACLGHFGLASKYYSHFTSPIRRYPDLVIHRIIREFFSKEKISQDRLNKLEEFVADAAEQSSIREKVAEEAERESVDMKKVEYMQRHLGDVFPGFVSSVLPFGLFVELENTVEGLVHVSSLTDDYYEYLEDRLAFIGQHTNKMIKIGDPVKIQVAKVNIAAREIDFELVEE